MTDIELLDTVLKKLNSIQVPVQHTQQISVPIIDCCIMLSSLRNAIASARKQEKESEKPVTEDDIKIEDIEFVPEDQMPKE